MTKEFTMDIDLLQPFTDHIDWEGAPVWTCFPQPFGSSTDMAIVSPWTSLLSRDYSVSNAIVALWRELDVVLPRTYCLLIEKVLSMALLRTDTVGASLVYFFKCGDELLARRGYLPLTEMPGAATAFPVDLSVFYRLHDGWVNFHSADGGLLPAREWQTIPNAGESSPAFIKVATKGTDAFGFDISVCPAACYALWPNDEEVELVDLPWEFLDNWMASSLEDMDSVR